MPMGISARTTLAPAMAAGSSSSQQPTCSGCWCRRAPRLRTTLADDLRRSQGSSRRRDSASTPTASGPLQHFDVHEAAARVRADELLEHDVIDRRYGAACRIGVAVGGRACRCRATAPTPDGEPEWRLARRDMPPVVTRSVWSERSCHQVETRILELSRRIDRVPVAQRTNAIELHVGKHTVHLLPHEDQVGLRERGIGEERVAVNELIDRDYVDELGISAAVTVLQFLWSDSRAANHVRSDVESVVRVLALDRE